MFADDHILTYTANRDRTAAALDAKLHEWYGIIQKKGTDAQKAAMKKICW
jgi:hypothetical protein